MDDPQAWPAAVTAHLAHQCGGPVTVTRLGGMSGASVWRARFAEASAIVKAGPSRRERLFYEHTGVVLDRAGVAMPRLLWSAESDGSNWLILEDIAAPFPVPPPEQWRPDPRMVAMLARLHSLTLDLPAELITYPAWDWTEQVTEAALSFFAPVVARNLAAPIRSLRDQAMHLSEQWCWISGDPNPSNWGVRTDGSLVLFDWELARRGAPPTDLAITVAGLGDPAKYEAVAACYLAAWPAISDQPPWSPPALARDIALAKAWSVVTLLRTIVEGKGRIPEQLRSQLSERVPPWLESLAR